jgi:mycofactocin precursor
MSPITLERPAVEQDVTDTDLLDEDDELLIEEISIDGMCGVY